MRPGIDEVELALDPSVEPDDVLAAAIGRGLRVRRFEVAEASLEQLFIERVGRPAGDETTLGPASAEAAADGVAPGGDGTRSEPAPGTLP